MNSLGLLSRACFISAIFKNLHFLRLRCEYDINMSICICCPFGTLNGCASRRNSWMLQLILLEWPLAVFSSCEPALTRVVNKSEQELVRVNFASDINRGPSNPQKVHHVTWFDWPSPSLTAPRLRSSLPSRCRVQGKPNVEAGQKLIE